MNPSERNKLCNFIRKEVLTMVYSAKEGHVGSSFSCVEAIVTLYFDIMNIDSKNPEWIKEIGLYYPKDMQHLFFTQFYL